MLRTKIVAISLGVTLTANVGAACPVSECNYRDPQWVALEKTWSACVLEITGRTTQALASLGVKYPKFGSAYRAMNDETAKAFHADGTSDQAVADAAKQRFEDRIFRTAEPEAVEQYNLILLQLKQHPIEVQCGKAPEPPRKQQQ
jgi:hypothetical protein